MFDKKAYMLEYNKQYRLKHKAKMNGQSRDYRILHPNAIKEYKANHVDEIKKYNKIYGKQYKLKNKEKIRERDKKYYINNIERLRAKSREYSKTDIGRIVDNNKTHRRRSAMKKTDINTSWLNDLKKMSVECPLCGDTMNEVRYDSKSKHLDHIVLLSLGGTHTMNNVRYICQQCNLERPKDGSDIAIKERVAIS